MNEILTKQAWKEIKFARKHYPCWIYTLKDTGELFVVKNGNYIFL